ncbi:16S rRNA (cytosine(967)-C(5))-methyltransferase RsmB [Candidatus Electronema sp. PJ]|uniref:16S rRNA (cytosine(967)-C(5))-methyltransferase RsmB n=1 Tax=Candidatus Electronema sp. PJ TaxID=3401572 RepID=UPI003AA7C7F3
MKKKDGKQTSRGQAIACLVAWNGTGKPIQGFLDTLVYDSGLSHEDRQLAGMLVFGVLRRQGYLDAIISRFAKTALRKMEPLTLFAFRVGVLQLCFLERIPAAAAVNETVAALKTMHQPAWLLGFVNATLRAIAKEKASLTEPEAVGLLDHPVWLLERWRKHFGEETMREICRINSLEPQLCLHSLRTGREELARLLAAQEIRSVAGQYAPESLLLPDWRGAITSLPGFANGLFQVQDQAAQLVCQLLGPFREQGRYLDGCAGLGGKTCALAALLPAGAALNAVEPDERRVRLLHENLKRQKVQAQVSIFPGDLAAFAASKPLLFDGILIDAPCSGTGVIRRHPDIRWNRQPGDFAALQATQLSLLNTAAKLLAPGGVLVYATCSLEPEENQQVIEQFLSVHNDFRLKDCRDFLPASAVSLVDKQGFFLPLPAEEIEGFFAARLERVGGE